MTINNSIKFHSLIKKIKDHFNGAENEIILSFITHYDILTRHKDSILAFDKFIDEIKFDSENEKLL